MTRPLAIQARWFAYAMLDYAEDVRERRVKGDCSIDAREAHLRTVYARRSAMGLLQYAEACKADP